MHDFPKAHVPAQDRVGLPSWRSSARWTVSSVVLSASLLVGACAMSGGSATPLIDTQWKLTRLAGSPALVQGQRSEPTLSLSTVGNERRFGGSSGCNRFAGGFETDGSKLKFGAAAATKMACEPQVMAIEQRLFKALGDTAAYRIDGGSLKLLDAQGAVLAEFEATAAR